MWVLLVSLIVLGIFTFLITKFQQGASSQAQAPEKEPDCKNSEYCCGAHEICEEGKKKRSEKKWEYYEDEELDRFRGKTSDSYTEEEIAEFREVLETLRKEEINGWLKSLNLRGINFPRSLIGLLSSRLQWKNGR
ncbi:MAG: phospholipase [Candidatus Azobacteroides sp.]|nr:phospholipase [Candidatus Azobacteroides sp.]